LVSHLLNIAIQRAHGNALKTPSLQLTLPPPKLGHTHVDELEIAYSDYTAQSAANALEVSYICPSMTPTSGAPAFRVYTIDPVTFGVLDMTTYTADISTTSGSGPQWTKYYSAKESYGSLVTPPVVDPAAELTPAFWHDLTVAMEADDAVFQAYYARKSRSTSESDTCTGACKTAEICQLRAAQAQYNCATVTPGISFSKRGVAEEAEEEVLVERGECEGSVMRPVLARLASRKELVEDALERAQMRARARA
jgi:sphingomyelin phosphodiesterase